MKKLDITIDTYEYKDGFRVEIYLEPSDNTWESFLYHVDYGIKMGMFGWSAEDDTKDVFTDFVIDSVDEYIRIYKEEYMD